MVLTGVTFLGPETHDSHTLDRLPDALKALLTEVNGFVAYRGGLHIRGACDMPSWHSIDAVWSGVFSLHGLYDAVLPSDVPFGQDYRGHQLLLRENVVWRLDTSNGQLTCLDFDLDGFLTAARCDPVDFLGLQPLRGFLNGGGMLRPGHVLDLTDFEDDDLTPLPGWVRGVGASHALVARADELSDAALAAG
jgi:hypothetical protein